MSQDTYMVCLVREDGELFYGDKTQFTVGRSEKHCNLVVTEDRRVSRCHAMFVLRGEQWYLVDDFSTRGTWLNGVKLIPGGRYPINVGDVIKLAYITLGVRELWSSPCRRLPLEEEWDTNCTVDPSLGEVRPAYPEADEGWYSVDEDFAEDETSEQEWRTEDNVCHLVTEPSSGEEPSLADARPAPPGAGKGMGIFSGIFDWKNKPAKKKQAADDVQFRATAPKKLEPGEYFPVKIMMYREDDHERADRESALVADETKSDSSSVFQAEVGQEFRIVLQSPDIPLDGESQTLVWNGKFAAATFEAFLPGDYSGKQLRLRGRVYSGDAVLTDLKLILQVNAPAEQVAVCEKVKLTTAFLSYASADRERVVARIQGIQAARPDMDLFFDVESLRCGEIWETRLYREIASRDLFYLFWSRNAAASRWVAKELEYAVSKKTLDFIEPIPLESPETCPPPRSLNVKHFNDWTLRYIKKM